MSMEPTESELGLVELARSRWGLIESQLVLLSLAPDRSFNGAVAEAQRTLCIHRHEGRISREVCAVGLGRLKVLSEAKGFGTELYQMVDG